MTAEEKKYLKLYLNKTQKIPDEAAFEEWYQQDHEGDDAEGEYKHTLDLAKTFADGYRQGWYAHQELIHRVWNGKPDEAMPPWRAGV